MDGQAAPVRAVADVQMVLLTLTPICIFSLRIKIQPMATGTCLIRMEFMLNRIVILPVLMKKSTVNVHATLLHGSLATQAIR